MRNNNKLGNNRVATERIELVGVNKTQKAFNDVQKSMGRLESNTGKAGAAFSKLQGIIIGAVAAVGAFKLSKDFLNTAVEVENLAIQLKFLTGSAEKGAEAFETLTDFAAGVPFQLQEIANSAPLLLTVTVFTPTLTSPAILVKKGSDLIIDCIDSPTPPFPYLRVPLG